MIHFTDIMNARENVNLNNLGGKGLSLVKLYQAGFNVPKGIILHQSMFDSFLNKNNLNEIIDVKIGLLWNDSSVESIEKTAIDIKNLIDACPLAKDILPESEIFESDYELFIVRSSAFMEDGNKDAWAGQLESYLGVYKKDLPAMVKNCWISMFSKRALQYMLRKKYKRKLTMSVIIQKQILSKKAGVVFTVNPITQSSNEILIEACFGQGEALVSGQVSPERLLVDKNNNAIIEITLHNQKRYKNHIDDFLIAFVEQPDERILTKNEIGEIINASKAIEKLYNVPMDIEWCIDEDGLSIVQARPITTLK